ncbi:MAG: hypothetical protein HQK75_06620 [Candidatus Magnetomorum sp.]|nr:hypothetical protein [Candidatus Magnetomorum sp.]
MFTDPDYILNQIAKDIKKYPEMAIQTFLEMMTVSEYTQQSAKAKMTDSIQRNNFVHYEMTMFEEDELNILEKEYKNYLGFDIEQRGQKMNI